MSRCICIALVIVSGPLCAGAQDSQTRAVETPAVLQAWLQNMVWHHGYTMEEVRQVTGLNEPELRRALREFKISAETRPARPRDEVLLLPYPGGRHPRIGFLDGAIDPQRETKLSAFAPWDDHSYAVLDIPEAIWSQLGLTYLAHTHVDTIWTKQGIELPQLEWQREGDGAFRLERELPNGIRFGTRAKAMTDHVRMEMWLVNGTDQPLTDLRVQNCVMLKGMDGFNQQTNDNKQYIDGYAIVKHETLDRYIITAWTPLHRGWGNDKCPCLHSDPKFADSAPGDTKVLRGWFSFYEGDEIEDEVRRIRATGWEARPLSEETASIRGTVRDAATGELMPVRLYVQNLDTGEWHFAQSDATDGSAVIYDKQIGNTASMEKHTSLSAHPFRLRLPHGKYRVETLYGKEFLPTSVNLTVSDSTTSLDMQMRRFADMPKRGWYSGDTHVHRKMEEVPTAMLAEDLNVALPLNYWVRDSRELPSESGPALEPKPNYLDDTHVIYPINTEYEIFTVNGKRHTQGAVFVLNHRYPLTLKTPPAAPVAEEARRQGAILDLDKHSWNWSMMIVPVMNVDLFELTNNHNWRTEFGFPQWTLENAPDWPEIERDEKGFTEAGWTAFGMETYYALLNCDLRMRVTGGTASGVHPVPLGHGRVYVHTGDEFNYERWMERLNLGHSFVTNGPLLDVRFNGKLPGTTFSFDDAVNSITVTGVAESARPIRSIEILRNGVLAKSVALTPPGGNDPAYRQEFRETIELDGSGWIAVRCFEDLPNERTSFAHTNPVFVDVSDRPLIPRRRDAEFFVTRMTEEIARNKGLLSEEAIAEYEQARAVYEAVLNRAR